MSLQSVLERLAGKEGCIMQVLSIRPRLQLTAFQWDGSEVEGFQRIGVGLDELQNPCCNLVATMLGRFDEPVESFAVPGDWIVTNSRGSFVWPNETFAATYEIIEAGP